MFWYKLVRNCVCCTVYHICIVEELKINAIFCAREIKYGGITMIILQLFFFYFLDQGFWDFLDMCSPFSAAWKKKFA